MADLPPRTSETSLRIPNERTTVTIVRNVPEKDRFVVEGGLSDFHRRRRDPPFPPVLVDVVVYSPTFPEEAGHYREKRSWVVIGTLAEGGRVVCPQFHGLDAEGIWAVREWVSSNSMGLFQPRA